MSNVLRWLAFVAVTTLTGCSLLTTPAPPEVKPPWHEVRQGPPDGFQPDPGVHRIVVLHTNDIHGQRMPLDGKGGLAQLAGEIDRIRKAERAKGNTVLVLDAGDLFSGSSAAGDQGDLIVDYMNLVRYDALTIGITDFERGADNLARLSDRAQFPFLAANLVDGRTGDIPEWAMPFKVFAAGPVKVAVVGVVTPRANTRIPAGNRGDLTFADPTAVLRRIAPVMVRRNVPVTIVLAHQGVDEDVRLAQGTSRVALFVSGSSEISLEQGGLVGREGEMLLATTAGRTSALGRVDLVVAERSGALLEAVAHVVPIDGKGEPHLEVAELIRKAGGIVDGPSPVVLTLPTPLTRAPLDATGPSSSRLGNAVADAMLAAAKGLDAELALVPVGDLKGDLPAGEVRRNQLENVLAGAGEEVVVVELSGKTLFEVLGTYLDDKTLMFEVSKGTRVEYDPTKPAEARLARVTVAGQLDRVRMYRVALSVLQAGAYPAIKDAKGRRSVGVSLVDAVIEHFKTFPSAPQAEAALDEKRIVPIGAGGGVANVAVLLPDRGKDAEALYEHAKAWFDDAKAKGRVTGPEPKTGADQIASLAATGDYQVLVIFGYEQYLTAMVRDARVRPSQRYLLVTVENVAEDPADPLPANVTVLRVPAGGEGSDRVPSWSEALLARLLAPPSGHVEILKP